MRLSRHHVFLFESNSLKKNHLLSLQSSAMFILGSPFVEPQVQLLPRKSKWVWGGCLVGKVKLSCFTASQEVWVTRPLLRRQNRAAGSEIQGSEVAQGHKAKQGNTGSVASTLSTTLPCLSLPASPLSHLNALPSLV